MTVLLIGATGYIGSALVAALRQRETQLITASRGHHPEQPGHRQVDTTQVESLVTAMQGIDTVINCVSGDARSIGEGARCLVEAASRAGVKKIIHMSSMAVYGFSNALMDENTALAGEGNWYAEAKVQAESAMAGFAAHGEVVIFRIGCVAGPGSSQWVERIGDLLKAGRIGDLGSQGDGWSNIVALDDVCQAVVLSVYQPPLPKTWNVFNLAAPDSPRWNSYFRDFALASGATPVRRISKRQLQIEAYVKAPAARIYGKARRFLPLLPVWTGTDIPPSLLKLFHLAGKLETSRIEAALPVRWTRYEDTVRQGAAWYVDERHRRSTA